MDKIYFNEQLGLIHFNNHFTYSDGSFVYISLSSICLNKSDKNLEDLEHTISTIFKNATSPYNMDIIVYIIRTIFNKFDEKELKIEIGNGSKTIAAINYKDKIMNKYEKSFSTESEEVNILYNFGQSMSFKVTDKDQRLLSYPLRTTVITKLEKELELIESLTSLKGKQELSCDEQCLCKAYRLFYEESPDFRKQDCLTKMQSMTFILSRCGINLGEEYSFRLGKDYPFSLKISNIAFNLRPLGLISDIDFNIQFNDKAEKTTEEIGRIIRENLKKDLATEIATLASVIYLSEYVIPHSTEKQLAEHIERDEESIKKNLRLIEKIKSFQRTH